MDRLKRHLHRDRRNWIRDANRVSKSSTLLAGFLSALPATLLLSFSFSLDFASALQLFASGAFFALGYASVFRSAKRSGINVGVRLAIYHWILNGLVLGSILGMGPMFLREGTLSALNVLVSHIVFGGVFGFIFDRMAIRYELPRPIRASEEENPYEIPLTTPANSNSSMLQ